MSDGQAIRPWQLVSSAAGRDSGQVYLVLRTAGDGFVELVNGDRRRVEAPKRKNARHLIAHEHVAVELAERVRDGGVVKNSEVRSALEQLAVAAGLRDRQAGSGESAAAGETQIGR